MNKGKTLNVLLTFNTKTLTSYLEKHATAWLTIILSLLSTMAFVYYFNNGLSLSYNDARSHLDISRRVVEGLKPGLAQLGSVWLPLPHFLMIPFIWDDYLWHSGLAGALISMVSYVVCGLVVYKFLKELGVGLIGRLIGVFIFATNLNILYLQSTAMTELLLLATMTAGAYELMIWHKTDNILNLIKSAFWIMLSTLTRYDGWFLLLFAMILIVFKTLRKKSFPTTEGIIIVFTTLAGFGIILWLLWNQLIFKDAFYFVFGPFSAKSQQDILEKAGNLPTKGNLGLSILVYLYALMYNSGTIIAILAAIGSLASLFDKKLPSLIKLSTTALFAPLFFNIIALFFGHSVLYVQGISGNTWFNIRYGIMLAPTLAIFIGYLTERAKQWKWVIVSIIFFYTFFSYLSFDAVTLDDARFGSSQKNVTEVSSWLRTNVSNQKEYILVSVASHDAIIFSSGLPMKRFIHEGTGDYWSSSIQNPDRWVRWIIMRTYDDNDLTYRMIKNSPGLNNYKLINSFPFADIYELKSEYMVQLDNNENIPNL